MMKKLTLLIAACFVSALLVGAANAGVITYTDSDLYTDKAIQDYYFGDSTKQKGWTDKSISYFTFDFAINKYDDADFSIAGTGNVLGSTSGGNGGGFHKYEANAQGLAIEANTLTSTILNFGGVPLTSIAFSLSTHDAQESISFTVNLSDKTSVKYDLPSNSSFVGFIASEGLSIESIEMFSGNKNNNGGYKTISVYTGKGKDWSQTDLDDPVAATPEPGTLALFGLGLSGIIGCGFRSRSRSLTA